MIDTTRIHQSVDLLTLIGRDTELKRVASTNGGEWAGPCPFCGGRDRFRVWPNANPPRWWCRQCARNGDAIAYIMQRDGLGFRAAYDALSAPRETLRISRPAQDQIGLQYPVPPSLCDPIPPLPQAENNGPPCETWQNRGREFVTYTQAQLWGDLGERALAYLRNRGLSDDTIRFFGLGYNPADLHDKPDRWGLAGKDIWLAGGVVIPCEVAGALWYVKIRRLAGKPKYIQPRGSKAALFGADDLGNEGRLLLLTEGEFDCMLGKQELGDLVDVATLGGAARGIDARWLPYLLPYKRILAAYDQDGPGQKGAAKLSQASRRILRINFADGDLTDYFLSGGDLRGLLAGEVEKHLVV
jgi:DNA primase